MKSSSITLTVAALLTTLSTANAWLGDSEDALIQHYGKPKLIQLSNGDIPTQQGYYAELKEPFGTNVSLITSTDTNYNMDLVENRKRITFQKDDLRIVVYVGNPGDNYSGVDFTDKSAREVVYCPVVWKKNTAGDKVGHPVAFAQPTINTILDNNKGDSSWGDSWQPALIPGAYLKRTTDNSRLAIAFGPSANEIYRLELRMTHDASRSMAPTNIQPLP